MRYWRRSSTRLSERYLMLRTLAYARPAESSREVFELIAL